MNISEDLILMKIESIKEGLKLKPVIMRFSSRAAVMWRRHRYELGENCQSHLSF